jgi:signal transduction histidine kinase
MPPRAPSQVRVETLIARGRLILAAFMVVALLLAAPQAGLAAQRTAIVHLGWAGALALLVRTRYGDGPRWPAATHAVDLTAYGVMLVLLGGFEPSMLAWFLFVLVAATLRWGWRGTLTTGSVAVALHVALGARGSGLRAGQVAPLEFITFALLMGVITVLVGLVGAYEDWRGGQLARLAGWTGPDPDQPVIVPDEMLEQTALVLDAPRTLIVWEESEEPWTEFALWSRGQVQRFREPPGAFGEIVASGVRGSDFFCRNLDARLPVTFVRSGGGLVSWKGMPIDSRLRERLAIRAVACWPLVGDAFRGWFFCLDKPGFSMQDLTVGDVVAGLASARVSQAYLVRSMRENAVSTERLRLARDLHDGVLQTLTGAALQLQTARRLLTTDTGAAEDRLSQVQRIIAAGQNDLRFFIQQLGPRRNGEGQGAVNFRGRVVELADRVRRQWGVPVTVATEPENVQVPDRLANDVFLLIHEALVNAARHARATSIQLAVLRGPRELSIGVVDDGQGFPFKGRFSLEDLMRDGQGPRTLRERMTALGGTLELDTSVSGTRLRIVVPLEANAS